MLNRLKEIINIIQDYINNLEKKELYMIYLSIFIVFGIIYYYFNLSLQTDIENLEMQKNKLYKEVKKSLPNLGSLKKRYTLMLKRNKELKEDYRYLATLLTSSEVLVVDKEVLFELLRKMLKISTFENIYPLNLNINSKEEKYIKTYYISMNGSFQDSQFFEFLKFIREFEKLKSLNSVKSISMSKPIEGNNTIDYNLTFSIWGVK